MADVVIILSSQLFQVLSKPHTFLHFCFSQGVIGLYVLYSPISPSKAIYRLVIFPAAGNRTRVVRMRGTIASNELEPPALLMYMYKMAFIVAFELPN